MKLQVRSSSPAAHHSRSIVDVMVFGLMILLHAVASGAQNLRILDRPVESFETGLAIHRNSDARWLDDDQLVITALAKGATEDAWDDPETRAVLVNFPARSIKVIAEKAGVLDADPDGATVLVGPEDRQSGGRQISIDSQGKFAGLRRFAPGEPLPSSLPDFPKTGLRVVRLLRKQDGYLFVDEKSAEPWQRGDPVPATWARPGRPPMPLPVMFQEIGPGVTYLRFLGKYLLNPYDSQISSNTNGALNSPARWNRPYILTPFRLLSLDGTIEEIRYPQFVFDYGIGKFGEFLVTRAGIAISQTNSVDGAIYLYKAEQLYRLTGTANAVGMPRRLRLSGVERLSLSADGCRIAYLHFPVPYFRITGTTPRYLSILDVCKETK
jgi:hypothetical protein